MKEWKLNSRLLYLVKADLLWSAEEPRGNIFSSQIKMALFFSLTFFLSSIFLFCKDVFLFMLQFNYTFCLMYPRYSTNNRWINGFFKNTMKDTVWLSTNRKLSVKYFWNQFILISLCYIIRHVVGPQKILR